ncbi:MAG: WG repeat-containing protein [Bacteroidia bacterium]
MYRYLILAIFLKSLMGLAQKDALIPFRDGNLFGLANIDGKLKLNAEYDLIQPIGNGYFKYSNTFKVDDTIRYYDGRIELKEKIITTSGLLQGTKVIIENSNHNHFTYSDQGIIIGSQESYVSKNSNFYTLKGEKLLTENVMKFRFLGYENFDAEANNYITIFAEHFDKSVSVLLFDKVNQEMMPPLLDHVTDFELDRENSSENYFVCLYTDKEYSYHRDAILFDNELKQFIIKPASKMNESFRDNNIVEEGMYEGASGDYVVEAPEIMNEPRVVTNDNQEFLTQREKPKPIVYFYKLNKGFTAYGKDTIKLNEGEAVSFADAYSKSQKQPLIVSKEGKYGLIFSDSLRSELKYDSLRYIKNQFGIFSSNHTFIYLAGNKNEKTGKYLFGIFDEKGKEIIPMMYENLQPNLLNIYIEKDEKTGQESFDFRQPYSYSKTSSESLKLQNEGILSAQLNGKFGVIDLENKTVMPFEYDFIWENGLNFLNTMQIEDKFSVYQKGNLYGVFKINSKHEKIEDTGLIFPNIPVFKYPKYNNISGFDLYNVAIAENLYYYLVGSNGKVYRK